MVTWNASAFLKLLMEGVTFSIKRFHGAYYTSSLFPLEECVGPAQVGPEPNLTTPTDNYGSGSFITYLV